MITFGESKNGYRLEADRFSLNNFANLALGPQRTLSATEDIVWGKVTVKFNPWGM
jgi:hypothetical protein